MKKNKGFSLVELIVVIAIMAILAAVAIPTFSTFIRKAQEASDLAYMRGVEKILVLTYAERPDLVMESIKVYVDPETNKIVEIHYQFRDVNNLLNNVPGRVLRTPQSIDEIDSDNGEDAGKEYKDNIILSSIDWDYQFKALDLNEDNQKWADKNWTFKVYDASDKDLAGDENANLGDNSGGETFDENDFIIYEEETGEVTVDSEEVTSASANEFDGDDWAGP